MNKKPAHERLQPGSFEFSEENKRLLYEILKKYPEQHKQSAVMPLLDLAQSQNHGWIPTAAIEHIAQMLNMPNTHVLEVASFYSMYNLSPVGEHLIQVCRTTPCWLRCSEDILNACKNYLNIDTNETTQDNKFTLIEVECLGACVNAPVVQINNDYYEDLTADTIIKILDKLRSGEKLVHGSQSGRKSSAPQ